MATPYQGKVSLWHWEGDAVGYPTIDALAQAIKTNVPVADAIWVKTSDAGSWQGDFDSKEAMKIRGPADIAKWVNTLANYGLEFHAWCVLRGVDVEDEVARIVQACSVPGVRSMILDVEPYQYYWQGSRQDVIRLMTGVRQNLG